MDGTASHVGNGPSLVAGKTVALVGNSSDALKRTLGDAIDSHDVVIRMNAGVPTQGQYIALGSRTDILAIGTIQCLDTSTWYLGDPFPQVWFWKATTLGDKQWVQIAQEYTGYQRWRIPKDWIREAWQAVGGRPSGGIGLVHALTQHMEPASISVFGFDFFGELGSRESWWHEQRPEAVIMQKHPHDGKKELAYFRDLGFDWVENGWWRR